MPCLHGKCPRRISSSYKKAQWAHTHRPHLICFSSCFQLVSPILESLVLSVVRKHVCMSERHRVDWVKSHISPLWVIWGVSTKLTDFFSPHSVWGEEWDKLWGMSEKRDGESWEREKEKTFCFCWADFILGLQCVCVYAWWLKKYLRWRNHSQWLLLYTC